MSYVVAFDAFAASLGISFVPVDAKSKRAYHDDWTNPERSFPPETFKQEDNVGGRWGKASGDLIDIDCDVLPACRVAKHAIKRGPRWGRPGKESSHYLLYCEDAKTKQFIDPFTRKVIVEIRATGSQSVLPPSRHENGGHYAWERQEPPPTVNAVDLRSGIGEIAAAALTASLWNPGSRHKFALLLAGFLAKSHVSEERARRLMEFVVAGAEDDEANDRLTAVRTTYEAYANGDDVKANFKDILGDKAATFASTLSDWLGLEREQFRIYSEATLLSRPAAPFLAKNLLVRGSLVAVVAPPDIGKTFLVLDLSASVAAAEPTWLGQPLLHHGPVVYVMGEGAGRFNRRYLAWKQVHGITRPMPFYWLDQPVPLLDEKAIRAFTRQVAPIKPVVIVFDTLSRCLMGGDENSQADMGLAMGMCDELKARTGSLIALLHHTKKDGTSERGSSVLRASVDTVLFLDEDEDERGHLTLRCDRQKDAEPFAPIDLERRVIQLDGVCDEFGEPETSCVIRVVEDDGEPRPSKEDKRDAKILAYVREHPECSKTAVCEAIGGRRSDVWKAVDELVFRKRLVLVRDKRLRVAEGSNGGNEPIPF